MELVKQDFFKIDENGNEHELTYYFGLKQWQSIMDKNNMYQVMLFAEYIYDNTVERFTKNRFIGCGLANEVIKLTGVKIFNYGSVKLALSKLLLQEEDSFVREIHFQLSEIMKMNNNK